MVEPLPARRSEEVEDGRLGKHIYESLHDLLATSRFECPPRDTPDEPDNAQLSSLRMILLTLVLAGAQLTWSVEQAYGTVFLISLSLSKELTALTWLAGPLSGLLAQPLIGAWSDASRSRFRRRSYIVGSAILVLVTLLLVAYAREVAALIVDSLSVGIEGSWDPRRPESIRKMSLIVAVPAFMLLDFALNALQASSRALILDTARHGQLVNGNAWQARLTHFANVLGFSIGLSDLAHSRALSWIPGGQFARLCVIASIFLTVCTTLTVVSTKEEEPLPWVDVLEDSVWDRFRRGFTDVGDAVARLPLPIRRICWAQFTAWLGWFSVLFYASFFVAEVYRRDHPNLPDTSDLPVRAGSMAMLFFALVALATGTVLPMIEIIGLSDWAHRRGWVIRWLLRRSTPRNIWTIAQLVFAAVMFSTVSVTSTARAMVVVALLGSSWAIACWIPFALVMQFIHETEPAKDTEDELDKTQDRVSYAAAPPIAPLASTADSEGLAGWPPAHTGARQRVAAALTECAPLIPRRAKRPGGATILGITNIAIVLPQFLTAIIASFVFRASGTGKHASIFALQRIFVYGGVMSLISAVATRYIPLTLHEMGYREQLSDDFQNFDTSSVSEASSD